MLEFQVAQMEKEKQLKFGEIQKTILAQEETVGFMAAVTFEHLLVALTKFTHITKCDYYAICYQTKT